MEILLIYIYYLWILQVTAFIYLACYLPASRCFNYYFRELKFEKYIFIFQIYIFKIYIFKSEKYISFSKSIFSKSTNPNLKSIFLFQNLKIKIWKVYFIFQIYIFKIDKSKSEKYISFSKSIFSNSTNQKHHSQLANICSLFLARAWNKPLIVDR